MTLFLTRDTMLPRKVSLPRPPASKKHPSCEDNTFPDLDAITVSQEHCCGSTFLQARCPSNSTNSVKALKEPMFVLIVIRQLIPHITSRRCSLPKLCFVAVPIQLYCWASALVINFDTTAQTAPVMLVPPKH